MLPKKVNMLGVNISLANRDELKECLIQTIYDKERFRILMLDEKIMFFSLFSHEVAQIVQKSEIVICSSQTVAWMVRMLTGKTVHVIMPVTIYLDLMRAADEMNYTVFLFGGTKNVALETLKRIRKSFAQARIVGSYRSNIKNQELQDVLITIRKSSPQIFIASYGSGPKQEKWISKNFGYYQSSITVGVGNSFKVIAGRKKMPPIWFQKKGWNGFYTTLIHPYNLARNFRIIMLVIITLFYKIRNKLKRATHEAGN
jgi:N-acetylglucosaminyldiphosphoundecaprenol N-acetyl-beta-D-mannosaminyltransferase